MKKESITAIEAIALRDKLSRDISRMWDIIATENVTEKGYKRNYDMKLILKKIDELSKQRVEVKLQIQLINMGYKKRSETPVNWLYPQIYELSEKNERYVKLGNIKTLDLALKPRLNKTEVLTRKYVTQLREKLQLDTVAIRKKLDDYNNEATLLLD